MNFLAQLSSYLSASRDFGTLSDHIVPQSYQTGMNGLIYRMIRDNPSLLLDPEIADLLGQLLGFKKVSGPLDVEQLAHVMTVSLLSIHFQSFSITATTLNCRS